MSETLFSLKNKLAIVTGGGTGLGFGITKAFVEAGAKVIITGRTEVTLKDASDELGDNVSYIVSDVSVVEELPSFVEKVESDFGEIDILVNNAGINMKKPLTDVTDAEFQNII